MSCGKIFNGVFWTLFFLGAAVGAAAVGAVIFFTLNSV